MATYCFVFAGAVLLIMTLLFEIHERTALVKFYISKAWKSSDVLLLQTVILTRALYASS